MFENTLKMLEALPVVIKTVQAVDASFSAEGQAEAKMQLILAILGADMEAGISDVVNKTVTLVVDIFTSTGAYTR